MEAVFVYILYLLGGLLSLRFNSACIVDGDCINNGARCCMYIKEGKLADEGVCLSPNSQEHILRCRDVCLSQADCFSPKRCDTNAFRCTTECFSDDQCFQMHADHDYICVYDEVIDRNKCIMSDRQDDPNSDSMYTTSFSASLKYILMGVIVLCLFICCICLRRRRRSRGEVRRFVATDARPTGTNAQQNDNAETLPMNSIQSPPEESNGQNLDAVAIGGPPSYIEVGDVPQSPPPTYEEATRT